MRHVEEHSPRLTIFVVTSPLHSLAGSRSTLSGGSLYLAHGTRQVYSAPPLAVFLGVHWLGHVLSCYLVCVCVYVRVFVRICASPMPYVPGFASQW